MHAQINHAKALGIAVVRHKDRFRRPALGGWRDCLLNFYFRDDPHRHVYELQLVHRRMLAACTGIPVDAAYARVRNAFELLQCAGVDMDVWWKVRARACDDICGRLSWGVA